MARVPPFLKKHAKLIGISDNIKTNIKQITFKKILQKGFFKLKLVHNENIIIATVKKIAK